MSWQWVSSFARLRAHATCSPEHLVKSTRTMLCLHHGTGCSQSWMKFAASFAAKGCDVLAFDRLGYVRKNYFLTHWVVSLFLSLGGTNRYGDSPATREDLPREFLLQSVQQV